jgi:hypothetical protein
LFERQIDDLERTLDAPLQVVYMKQLRLLRDKALQRFRTSIKSSESAEFDSMISSDEYFRYAMRC